MCPLLDPDGSCSIYDHRPMTCRSYHSFNASSDDCWPERVGPRDLMQVGEPIALALAMAVAEEERRPGSTGTLARALVALARKAQHNTTEEDPT
jgi:Fe-S-cluster containining protein